jgi:GntR family transcriptional regulator, transcriptional repressor for pyruvate dehydrogenase complex
MALNYASVVTAGVAKQIADDIREAILLGRIKVGERLPTEEELAANYGVSRPTIREALKLLAAQNLVRARRGPAGGSFVTTPEPGEMGQTVAGWVTLMVTVGGFQFAEIAQARLELETVCCRLAATCRDQADVTSLEAALAELGNAGASDEEFCAADVRFHRALVDATHNGPLRFLMYGIVEAMLPIMNMVVHRERNRAVIVKHHQSLLAAIAKRRPGEAVAALRGLMAYLSARYRSAAGSDGKRTQTAMTGPSRRGEPIRSRR